MKFLKLFLKFNVPERNTFYTVFVEGWKHKQFCKQCRLNLKFYSVVSDKKMNSFLGQYVS